MWLAVAVSVLVTVSAAAQPAFTRINLGRTARTFFDDLFSNPAYQPFNPTPEQVFAADELRINRDPFDALICAAAQQLDLPLLTRDEDIRSSGVVRVTW